MTRRISVLLSLCLLLTTNAWAQLASQTALVGTVTDSGGLVVPGAQVVAVNTGTKDTYEATTNTEGYYHIPFVRPGKYESRSRSRASRRSRPSASKSPPTRSCARMPPCRSAASANQ